MPIIKALAPKEMKDQLQALAKHRGEKEAAIIRRAVLTFLSTHKATK